MGGEGRGKRGGEGREEEEGREREEEVRGEGKERRGGERVVKTGLSYFVYLQTDRHQHALSHTPEEGRGERRRRGGRERGGGGEGERVL